MRRHILLYILDLLAVFASKAEFNRMRSEDLATIFQRGILSHPQHDLALSENRLSQGVVVFLIEHQDSFLIDDNRFGCKDKVWFELVEATVSDLLKC